MRSLRFTPAARADLTGIWDYTEEVWGTEQAETYALEIQRTLQAVASGLRSGREPRDFPRYRAITSGKHVIYYRVEGASIDVIRILHFRMDPYRHL